MSSGALVKRKPYKYQGLDDYITDVALNKTMGDLIQLRTAADKARTAFVCGTICNAVLDLDIGLIAEIVKRIDGAAPAKGDIDNYSNIFSDALADVLEYDQADQVRIFPSDPPIIALAKATVVISMADPGKNVQARKDRQRAVAMILDRVEGRQSEPERVKEIKEYSAPDWLGLPEKEDE